METLSKYGIIDSDTYKKWCLANHPDKFVDASEKLMHTITMQEVTEAYSKVKFTIPKKVEVVVKHVHMSIRQLRIYDATHPVINIQKPQETKQKKKQYTQPKSYAVYPDPDSDDGDLY